MSGQENKVVVRRYYEEVFNRRDTGLIDQLAVDQKTVAEFERLIAQRKSELK